LLIGNKAQRGCASEGRVSGLWRVGEMKMVYTGTMIEELIAAVEREERRLAAGNEQISELGDAPASDFAYSAEQEQLPRSNVIQFAQTA
jgi:hypothetical protein